MMQKELYITPEMDITYLEAEDIITTSLGIGDETEEFSLFELMF